MSRTRWQPKTEADFRIVAQGVGNPNNIPMCENCKYFYQHYGLIDGRYRKICAGHCGYLRIKERRPHDLCENHSYVCESSTTP